MAEITKAKSNDIAVRSGLFAVLCTVLPLLTYFVGLGLPLLGPDEPRYAQVAREMFERGDLITPTLGGHGWFEKPVLLYWLEMASFQLFGVNETAVRLGPALFGVLTVAALWLFARFAVRGNSFGISSKIMPAVAASTVGIIAFAHGASFDIILTLPITASLVCYFVYDRSESDSRCERPALAGFYFFIGVGLLAKGLVGAFFPAGIVAAYHALSLRLSKRSFYLGMLWGGIIAAMVAGIWYVPMYQRNGWKFIDEFIIQHHFQRYTSNKYQHPQPFYFFFWVLPMLTIPWVPFWFAETWRTIKSIAVRFSHSGIAGDRFTSASIFALAWAGVPLVFFTLSGSKLPGYIMPSVPGAVILAWIAVEKFAARSSFRRIAVLSASAVTAIVIIALLTLYMPSFALTDSVKPLITAAQADISVPDRRPVLCLHNVSHNAEFYAAGRLVRNDEGAIRRFGSADEVKDLLVSSQAGEVLVIVPTEYVDELRQNADLVTTVIAAHDELAIASVGSRSSF